MNRNIRYTIIYDLIFTSMSSEKTKSIVLCSYYPLFGRFYIDNPLFTNKEAFHKVQSAVKHLYL